MVGVMVFDLLGFILGVLTIWASFGVLAYVLNRCFKVYFEPYKLQGNVLKYKDLTIVLLFGPVVFYLICDDIYLSYKNRQMISARAFVNMFENLSPNPNVVIEREVIDWQKNGF